MAKGYSARRGFSNGSGQMLKQQQMQQQIMKMQEDMQKAQQEVEEKTFSASVGGGVVSAFIFPSIASSAWRSASFTAEMMRS